jgi:hypothetical protein
MCSWITSSKRVSWKRHRTPQVVGEHIEVMADAHADGEALGDPGGVVSLPVESPVDGGLHMAPDGHERRGGDEGRGGDQQVRVHPEHCGGQHGHERVHRQQDRGDQGIADGCG